MNPRIVILLFLVTILAGCSFGYGNLQAEADAKILDTHAENVANKTWTAAVMAVSCNGVIPTIEDEVVTTDVPAVVGQDGEIITPARTETTRTRTTDFAVPQDQETGSCEDGDSSCFMATKMVDAFTTQFQTGCVVDVAEQGAKVAIEVPKLRAHGAVGVAEAVFGQGNALDNNLGILAGTYGIKQGYEALTGLGGVLERMGRPTVDNSVSTSDSYNEQTDHSGDTAGRDIVGGNRGGDTTTIADNGSQVGDRGDDRSGNSGRQDSTGQDCTGTQCQPANSLNPDNSNPPQTDPPLNLPSPIRDGVCLSMIWSLEAQAIDADCPAP